MSASIPRSTLPLGTDKWGEGRVQLPAHNPLPQMLKLGLSETLGKNVAQLVRGIDFGELDVARTDLRPKPVILHSVVFRPGCHATGLHFAENKAAGVVLVDLDVKM